MKFTTRQMSPVILTALLLSACGSPQQVSQPMSPQSAAMLQPVSQNTTASVMADVGKGIKTPAQLSFRINLEDVSAFRTQASTAGVAAKTKDDLTHIKFYLVESDTGSPPTELGGTPFTYEISADNRTNNRVDITFTNVAANASGKSYYVMVAGFSSAIATEANNITNFSAPIDDTTEGLYYISNSGGSPAGAVRVTPVTYAISGTSALGVPLKLLNAVSPVLDSDVTITAGDEISGTPNGNPG